MSPAERAAAAAATERALEAVKHEHGCDSCSKPWTCLCYQCQGARRKTCWPCRAAGRGDE